MANTYTQIHIQCVVAVKYLASLIDKHWKEQLHKYITGNVQNNGHKMLAINCMQVICIYSSVSGQLNLFQI